MPLWSRLYGMVWLSFFAFLTILPPLSPALPALVHMLIGVAVIALAAANRSALGATAAPARLKRVARATLNMSIAAAVIGILLFVVRLYFWNDLVGGLFQLAHLAVAAAILTQAASVATAYDMWEEREFLPVGTS